MKKSCLLALLVLTAATGVSAAEGESQEAPKKEKMICRKDKVTGSRTKVNRICMTKAQWDQQAAATKKGLDEMGRNAAGGANSSFDPSKMGGG
ncbi:hypothetical protein SZ64_06060 [Erythrobacter sp. SG61-1L]|uniref:hypothetical protein n=1 Tax=Erythrobacter sp. SG61-1L TaxID=1603897 RepID=UPI0006C905B3|nr:hypothetical protein [Erythrobacter sp. SG61-1L]KPL67719.1 hypothetical protein SZ64_06060 [Erythrobacter sp. SG61-1L]